METSKNETPDLNEKIDISHWHPDNQNRLVRELIIDNKRLRADNKTLLAEVRRLYLESAK